jgi:amphi-Trp domain-containing protein
MSEKILHEEKVSREEVADRLQAIAHELRGDEDANVDVGNKTVTLSPPSSVGYEIGTRESSSVLRGSRESITIKLDWKPE